MSKPLDRALVALRPKPRLLVSEWADRYRRIPRGTSPEPGAWHTDRAPYVRGIMDAVCDPAIETVVAIQAIPARVSPLLEGRTVAEIEAILDTATTEALQALHEGRYG